MPPHCPPPHSSPRQSLSGSDASSPPVGLIGLGLMGGAIAQRLSAHGYTLLGADPCDAAQQRFVSLDGDTQTASCRGVVQQCHRVILSLPTHREVSAVLHSVADDLQAEQIIIDTTTGDPCSGEESARRLLRSGVYYLDATVSGSSQHLQEGQVTWMVGGDRAACERCRDLFDATGRRYFHVGSSGNGSRMKLVSNLVLGLNRAALAEGLSFADTLELDLEQTLLVLRESPAYSRMMDSKGQKMIDREFSPQARLSQHLKDVQLMEQLAAAHGQPLPLTQTHREILQRAVAQGLGDRDNSALIEVMRKEDPAR